MPLARVVVGWGLVWVWFALWDELGRRAGKWEREPGGPSRPERARQLGLGAFEALLLTLFASLWFASLGHGGWLLLFMLVGLLMEVPARLRDGRWSPLPWARLLGSLVRILGAGGLLAWRLA